MSRRATEFGLRMALDADRPRIVSLVIREGLLLAMLGGALGLVVARSVTRLLSALLYGVTPTDVTSFGLAATVTVESQHQYA